MLALRFWYYFRGLDFLVFYRVYGYWHARYVRIVVWQITHSELSHYRMPNKKQEIRSRLDILPENVCVLRQLLCNDSRATPDFCIFLQMSACLFYCSFSQYDVGVSCSVLFK